MKQYPEYTDTTVSWLGKIPSHWSLIRGKFITNLLTGCPFDSDFFSKEESDMPLIRIRDISNSSTESYYSGEYDKSFIIKKGDILVGMDGDFNVAIWRGDDALLNQRVLKVNDTKRAKAKFLFYALPHMLKCINDVTYSTTVKHLSTGDIYNSFFAVPPIAEQEKIIQYLDEKCATIEKSINIQKSRIGLLRELRQNTISNAITKGINPGAETKDSGVPYLGMVPSHWKIDKVSRVFNYNSIGSGTTPSSGSSEYYDDNGHYWLQTGDLTDGVITDTSKKLTDLAMKTFNLKTYPKDSVVIAMYGATIGKVGLLGIPTSTNQACCVLPPSKRCLPEYAFYYFISAKQTFIIEASGGGQPNISQDVIRRHKMTLPPVKEQELIIEYLKDKLGPIDDSIKHAEERISLLQSYKNSLIYETVTGKRSVI